MLTKPESDWVEAADLEKKPEAHHTHLTNWIIRWITLFLIVFIVETRRGYQVGVPVLRDRAVT